MFITFLLFVVVDCDAAADSQQSISEPVNVCDVDVNVIVYFLTVKSDFQVSAGSCFPLNTEARNLSLWLDPR